MINLDVVSEARNYWTNWQTISFPSTKDVFVPTRIKEMGKK
jgi:hypothetical protein